MRIERNGYIVCIDCWGCEKMRECNTPCEWLEMRLNNPSEGEGEIVEAEFEDEDRNRSNEDGVDDMPVFAICSLEECKNHIRVLSAKLYKQLYGINQLTKALSEKLTKSSFWGKIGGIINR